MMQSVDNPDPKRRNFVWLMIQWACYILFKAMFRFRFRGMEQLLASDGGLLLINHQSFLDPILASVPLKRPIVFLARDSLFRVPFVGWVLRKTNVVPINRESVGTASLKRAVSLMKKGFLVGIFPEGTRSDGPVVAEFKPGFIALARRSSVPIYPIGIAGADRALPRGSRLPRPRQIRIVFGDPLGAEDLQLLKQRGREGEFLELARGRVIACQQEAEDWIRNGDQETTASEQINRG